jgi:hypothetical protein
LLRLLRSKNAAVILDFSPPDILNDSLFASEDRTMFAERGYYSLIQYCPDALRLEAVNVGLVLLCPALDYMDVGLTDDDDRIRRVFRSQQFRPRALAAAKRAIAERLRLPEYRPHTLEELQKFIDSRGNDLVLTPPRPVKVTQGPDELERLFRDLVLEKPQPRRERRNRLAPELEHVFNELVLLGRARRDVRTIVPVLGKELKFPYAYRNGALNLIKPQQFASDGNVATATAMKLAVEGDLIARHGGDEQGEKQMVIVAQFAGERDSGNNRTRVLGILAEFGVRAVPPEQVAEFAGQVRQEAD